MAQLSRRMQYTLLRELSLILDLIVIAMEAGLDFNLALKRVVEWGTDGLLSRQFKLVLAEIELGEKRIVALEHMVGRLKWTPLKHLLQSVHLSEQLGGNLAYTLRIQADALRQKRFMEGERRAQRIPVLLIFPLVFLIFPSIFLVLFGPIIYRIVSMGLFSA